MRFNINDHVRVRLTDRGRALHRQHHDELFEGSSYKPDYRPPVEDADGWSRWQLWRLMHEFGEQLYNGAPLVFETEIEVESATRRDDVLDKAMEAIQALRHEAARNFEDANCRRQRGQDRTNALYDAYKVVGDLKEKV